MPNFETISSTWTTLTSNQRRPPPRWGHSSCVVNQDLFIFGGFANSQYMNDLWVYSLADTEWKKIKTYGDVPAPRSNSTLSYDPVNRQLLLFGGGGPNRQRFNSVSTLDLVTMNWIQLIPFQNQKAPWERTYHTAQFKYPYLVVFGGQSAEDLGDLWVYNVLTLGWKQIKIDNGPCPRRFHASCLVENQMYIFGGCEGKYNCLGDLYRIDMGKLFENGEFEGLEWKQIKIEGEVVGRWGHTLHHYNSNLYIFGGRADEDMNELLSISLKNHQAKIVETSSTPQPRRRHHGGLVGSSLVLFGGFDGNYFDDLFFINLYQPQQPVVNKVKASSEPKEWVNDKEGKQFKFWSVLLGKYFRKDTDLMSFLIAIDNHYSWQQLEAIFLTFYRGWGVLPLASSHLSYLETVPEEEYQSNAALIRSFIKDEKSQESTGFICREEQNVIVELQGHSYLSYANVLEQHWQMESKIVVNSKHEFSCCAGLMSLFSQYFHCLFQRNYQRISNILELQIDIDPEAFRAVLLYLHTNILVLPAPAHPDLLKEIALLSHYFSLTSLTDLCQQALIPKVTPSNTKSLQILSRQLSMQALEEVCALCSLDQLIKSSSRTTDKEQKRMLSGEELGRVSAKSRQLYVLLGFELMHCRGVYSGSRRNAVLEEKENICEAPALLHKSSVETRSSSLRSDIQ